MLTNDVDNATLFFSVDKEFFGKHEEFDLIPNGRNIPVTNENKLKYIEHRIHFYLYGIVSQQVDAFLTGFHELIPKDLIRVFDHKELEMLISGLPNFDCKFLSYPILMINDFNSGGFEEVHGAGWVHERQPLDHLVLGDAAGDGLVGDRPVPPVRDGLQQDSVGRLQKPPRHAWGVALHHQAFTDHRRRYSATSTRTHVLQLIGLAGVPVEGVAAGAVAVCNQRNECHCNDLIGLHALHSN